MPEWSAENLVRYLAQLTLVIAAGAGLPALVGLSSPRARMVYFRVLLVVAVVAPLARLVPPSAALPASSSPSAIDGLAPPAVLVAASSQRPVWPPSPAPSVPRAPFAVGQVVAVALAGGTVARLAWVLFGLRALWRLRRRAEALVPRPTPIEQAVALTAADADFRLSEDVAHPVSFGARRPAVLLPRALCGFPDDEQRAVACHELIHVRRHDWVRTIGDEVVRAAFWFHPGIWWVLDQIHLSREQVVDREVVEITRGRRSYLEALVKLARPAARPALRPVSLFLRRAHLPQRVALLLEEVPMSRIRLFAGLASSLVVVAVASGVAVRALPLQAAPAAEFSVSVAQAAGQQAQRPGHVASGQQASRPGVPVRTAPPRLVQSVRPVYPPEALAARVEGVVILEAQIDPAGQVVAAKVLRSIPMLDQAAIDAVRQWRYEPLETGAILTVTIRFSADGEARAAAAGVVRGPGGVVAAAPVDTGAVRSRASYRAATVEVATGPVAAGAEGAAAVAVVKLSVAPDGSVSEARGVGGALSLWPAAASAARLWAFEEGDRTDSVLVGFNLAADSDQPAGEETGVRKPVRVGGTVKQPTKAKDVRPVYPDEAKQQGIQGVVIVEARVGTDGKVTYARVLRSIPALDVAALEAVLQWEFTPTLLNGAPVPVIMVVTLSFRR